MTVSRAVVCAVGLLSLAACDIPTEAPILEERWIFPVKSTSIEVDKLLPAGVTLVPGGARFAVNVPNLTVSQSLGQACPACAPFNGQTGSVPPFSTTLVSSSNLPANVASATLAAGTVQINVQNNFGFDPTTNGGSATITLTDGPGGRQLGQVSISGGTLPAGPTSRTLTLATGAVGATITATTVISNGSGGQTATINTNNQLSVTAIPTGIQLSAARVNVSGKSVTFTDQSLDVDIDDSLLDHIAGNGTLLLTITNPFGVAMNASLVIRVPAGQDQQATTITKSVNISANPTSAVSLTFSESELRSFLGKNGVTLSGTGTISATAGQINVTPGQKVGLDTKLDLTIKVG